MAPEVADFSGYATVHDTLCTDGRTITSAAFKHMDGMKVPLVWQHQHNDPENILGHAMLEYRTKGVYVYGYFNGTPKGQNSKLMIEHQDIDALSIFANHLVEKSKVVSHGDIKEVSLVIAGANPGAMIDNVYVRHDDDDGFEVVEGEAVIYTDTTLEHEDKPVVEEVVHVDATTTAPAPEATAQEVFDSLDQTQKDVVYYMIEEALNKPAPSEAAPQDAAAAQSAVDENDPKNIEHQEGTDMTGSRNLFENNGTTGGAAPAKTTLSHDDLRQIMTDAKTSGSFKNTVEAYALAHGIENLEVLFPDAKSIADRPEFIKRRTEWVAGVLAGTRHTPFSRIKTLFADITFDEARAKGYIKGHLKKEEFFSVSKRVTTPTTIYKKQKLDRDDIVDITDFDVVAWLKYEIRLMLDEEIARAVLIGDGRDAGDEDKIKDPVGANEGAGIRSVLHDHELFVTTVNLNIDDALSTQVELVDGIIGAMSYYKGSGSPTLYTTLSRLTKILLTRDTLGRRLWKTAGELASELMVSNIVCVEVMEEETDLIGIIVNLTDYNIGADKGGEINFFDDFDIDYNQNKYLMETRVSGALVKWKAAIVIKATAAANVLVAPTVPTFVVATGVATIPTKTGVVYQNGDTDATLNAGAQAAIAAGATLLVHAVPASGYYFADNANDDWTFTRASA